MSDQDKCIPWYLPPIDPNARLCSPFEARNFSSDMDKIQDDACQVGYFLYSNELHDPVELNLFFQHCLPDCEETHYTASVSAAPFRACDLKNFGLSPLCTFDESDDGLGSLHPPIWGSSVIEQYRYRKGHVLK